jgi:putative CocE/NonD family hydrolase
MGKYRRRRGIGAATGALLWVISLPAATSAQTGDPVEAYLEANYTREEHYVAMRDGARLFTVVFLPTDDSKTYPILLERTPYGADPRAGGITRGERGPGMALVREGYILVRQEIRGTHGSEGSFAYFRPFVDEKRRSTDVDESTDAYDTIEWLIANVRNHNGRVGIWGIGYAGFCAAAGMINAHPALEAVSPQAPVTDPWLDTVFFGGAFKLAHTLKFVLNFGETPMGENVGYNTLYVNVGVDLYRFLIDVGSLSYVDRGYLLGRRPFWNECTSHPTYDAFWRARDILPHLEKTAPAVMNVGGWFDDRAPTGALACYRAVEKQNPGVFNVLVMGPWDHTGWLGRYDANRGLGDIAFDSNTAEFYQENIEAPFFEYFLKDRGRRALPEAFVFETGTNEWRTFDRWPPKGVEARKLYFGAGGTLSFDRPAGENEGWDDFASDPANPVPVVSHMSSALPRGFMVGDQRFLAGRDDVVAYTTDVLESDVTVAGALAANLWVSTSRGDADWVVKLVDVFPTEGDDRRPDRMVLRGYRMLVRAGVLRGRYRESAESPKRFVPGEPERLSVRLDDVCHTFRRGHRIMIQVHGSWFPLIDRNPQTYVDNIFRALDDDFVAATHRVYRSPDRASHVEISVFPIAGR